MTNAVTKEMATPTAFSAGGNAQSLPRRALAIAIPSLFPATFWTYVLFTAGPLLGMSLSSATLAEIGIAIALFLALVVSALPARC
jgi:hypothetical protein